MTGVFNTNNGVAVGSGGGGGGPVQPPTVTKYETPGTYTYTVPVGVSYLIVTMCGGGGGGQASGSGKPAASNGGNSFFNKIPSGNVVLQADGGKSPVQSSQPTYGLGGAATVAESATVKKIFAVTGGNGGPGENNGGLQAQGGCGGTNIFGGSGAGPAGTHASYLAKPGAANTGAGGGGSGGGNTEITGGGGGAGGALRALITTPDASYAVRVGLGAAGCVNTNGALHPSGSGAAGGSGVVIIEEYYG